MNELDSFDDEGQVGSQDNVPDDRLSRENQTRDLEKAVEAWEPTSPLPSPEDDPDNDYRWVRVSCYGQPDNNNASAMFRNHWEAVPINDPKADKMFVIADKRSDYEGMIQMGGLLLCRRPKLFGQKQRDINLRSTNEAMSAVQSQLVRSIDQSQPLVQMDMKSKVGGFGEG